MFKIKEKNTAQDAKVNMHSKEYVARIRIQNLINNLLDISSKVKEFKTIDRSINKYLNYGIVFFKVETDLGKRYLRVTNNYMDFGESYSSYYNEEGRISYTLDILYSICLSDKITVRKDTSISNKGIYLSILELENILNKYCIKTKKQELEYNTEEIINLLADN